jgi:hypothetical protein
VHVRRLRPTELQGVADEVRQKLLELPGIREHNGQDVVGDTCAGLVDRRVKGREARVKHLFGLGRNQDAAASPDSRKRKKILDEMLHASHAPDREVDELKN